MWMVYHIGVPMSSLHVSECNIHVGYKWDMANEHDTLHILRELIILCWNREPLIVDEMKLLCVGEPYNERERERESLHVDINEGLFPSNM